MAATPWSSPTRPHPPGPEADASRGRATIELKLFTRRRADLFCDRTRAINRLRSTLTSMFPALERVLVLTSTGPLVLLTGYQTRRPCAESTPVA
jgi:hypothetical protein